MEGVHMQLVCSALRDLITGAFAKNTLERKREARREVSSGEIDGLGQWMNPTAMDHGK